MSRHGGKLALLTPLIFATLGVLGTDAQEPRPLRASGGETPQHDAGGAAAPPAQTSGGGGDSTGSEKSDGVARAEGRGTATPAESSPRGLPPGPATLRGEVIDAESGEPAPGVEVLVYTLPDIAHATTRSDDAGRFRFAGVANRSELLYLVGARHRGVAFPGERVQFRAGQEALSVRIRVGEPTESSATLRPRELELRVDWNGRELTLHHTLRIDNAGPRTAYVAAPRRLPARAFVELGLPAGSGDIADPSGLPYPNALRAGRTLRLYGPFYPSAWGERFATPTRFQHPVAATAGRAVLTLTVPQNVERCTVRAGPGISDLVVPGGTALSADERAGYAVTGAALAAPLTLELELPAPRIDPGALHHREARIILELDGAALRVTEEHQLSVTGRKPLFAPPDMALFRRELPEGIRDLRFDPTALDLGLTAEAGRALQLRGPLPPGDIPLHVAYLLPRVGETMRFATGFDTAVARLRVLVADTGLRVTTQRLHRLRPGRINTRTYLVWEGFDLAAGERVALELTPHRGGGGVPRWLAAGFAAALTVGVVLVLIAPLGGPRGVAHTVGVGAPGDPQTGHRAEREAIYAALRDLEHDRETEKLAADDYAEMRRELRARAAALLRDEDSLAAAPSGDTPAPVHRCAGCGTQPRPGDRFCAHCGTALAPRGAPVT